TPAHCSAPANAPCCTPEPRATPSPPCRPRSTATRWPPWPTIRCSARSEPVQFLPLVQRGGGGRAGVALCLTLPHPAPSTIGPPTETHRSAPVAGGPVANRPDFGHVPSAL